MRIKIDTKDFNHVIRKMKRLDEDLKKQVPLFIESAGFDFLDIVQDQIIKNKSVVTRRLLNSFDKGGNGNVWKIHNGGLTLIVGTNVEYASLVNDGHWTISSVTSGTLPDGTPYRWVPGHWKQGKFIYTPGASEGMVLTQQWVEGTSYFDDAVVIFRRLFEQELKIGLKKWAKNAGGV